jgi:hypothetical protein
MANYLLQCVSIISLALMWMGVVQGAPPEGAASSAGGKAAQTAERAIERYPVLTIPVTDIMEVSPPQSPTKRRDWREVERTLEQLRQARKDFGQPCNELHAYYSQIADPKFTSATNYAQHLEQLNRWREEIPDSAAALTVAALANVHYAWQARGGGTADKVTGNGWVLFATRIKQARDLIEEALRLGARDGEAHRVRINVALGEGGSKPQVYSWLEAGRKFDPTYYPMYEQMAIYLLPRWHGEVGEVEKFASDLRETLPGDIGLEAMARVALSVHSYGEPTMYGDALCFGRFDHDLLVRAAETLCKRHPEAPRFAHFAALCAMVAQDHEAAQRIRPMLTRFNADHKIWLWEQSYNHFWAWSGAAENPAGETNRAWATQSACAGIAFGSDDRHVWCAQQFGKTSVNLMNVRTGALDFALPHPGGSVNALAVDNERRWVVTAAWRGKFIGWSFYDLRAGIEPLNHATAEKCDAVAIHPKLPRVYWTESRMLHSWDVADQKPGPDVPLPEIARKIRFSPDGNLMAVDMRRVVVYDTANGNLKYELPYAAAQPRPEIDCKNLLGIDSEGRVLVHAVMLGQSPSKVPVVRFAADGSSWEAVIPDARSSESYLSPDGRLLAVARVPDVGPFPIDVWDLGSGQKIKRLSGHWNRVGHVEFSGDGQKLASIGRTADVIKIWSLQDVVELNTSAAKGAKQ